MKSFMKVALTSIALLSASAAVAKSDVAPPMYEEGESYTVISETATDKPEAVSYTHLTLPTICSV